MVWVRERKKEKEGEGEHMPHMYFTVVWKNKNNKHVSVRLES